jgi:hypothetical protein
MIKKNEIVYDPIFNHLSEVVRIQGNEVILQQITSDLTISYPYYINKIATVIIAVNMSKLEKIIYGIN